MRALLKELRELDEKVKYWESLVHYTETGTLANVLAQESLAQARGELKGVEAKLEELRGVPE